MDVGTDGGAATPGGGEGDDRLHVLSHQIPVGIFETDPNGALTFANERWCAMAGLDHEEARGFGWTRAVHPADRKSLYASWSEAKREDREWRAEYRLMRPDGTEVYVIGSATAICDEHGEVTGYRGSCVDVTAHRRLQADRLLQEQRFSMAFDHAPIGIALVAPDGRWLRVNRALCNLTGYAESELLAKTFQDLTHPDDLEADLELVERVLSGELNSYEMEKRYFRADGRTIWALLSVALVRGEDDQPLYFISQILDITERKDFERELAHLADHDGLTGLPNRRCFRRELGAQIGRARRYGRPAALLFIDLDEFKGINDSLGHKVGDDLIRTIGETLSGRVRDSDVLARLGGDEFGVLLTETDLAGAEVVARELSQAIRDTKLRVGGRSVRITASVGIAPLDGHSDSEDDLLVTADLAMYDAKRAGRDRIAIGEAQRVRPAPARTRLLRSRRRPSRA